MKDIMQANSSPKSSAKAWTPAQRQPSSPIRVCVRPAFTLVELMIVIAIIGVLAGLTLAGVFRAVNSAREAAHKLEVDTLAQAVEKYRDKYGDYPPDGSSWQIMERHLRKAFPQILASELNMLDPTSPTALAAQGWSGGNPWQVNGASSAGLPITTAGIRNDFDQNVTAGNGYALSDHKVMDPAEALVFFLGGFSSNPQRPFTGEGGPFVVVGAPAGTNPTVTLTAGQALQYNSQRSNQMFEFKDNRLTLFQDPTTGVVISTDEEKFLGMPQANDLLPVYLAREGIEDSLPYVYFDSRTYVQMKGAAMYSNYYQRSSVLVMTFTNNADNFGAIRPLVSDIIRSPALTAATTADLMRFHLFMEEKKFQVHGPGVDNIYGGRIAQDIGSLAEVANSFISLPSGRSYAYSLTGLGTADVNKAYQRLRCNNYPAYFNLTKGLADNAANCTEKTYEASLSAPGS
jgi:prepilin-type N-terminal cleavage/methylation domain-containing protein